MLDNIKNYTIDRYSIYLNGHKKLHAEKAEKKEIDLCEQWIDEFASFRKTINTDYNSYNYKHAVEKWSEYYIPNGAFIQAAINKGFNFKAYQPNAYFNLKIKKSIMEKRHQYKWND